MGKLQGRLLIGVINSVAVRRDAKAFDGLIEAPESICFLIDATPMGLLLSLEEPAR